MGLPSTPEEARGPSAMPLQPRASLPPPYSHYILDAPIPKGFGGEGVVWIAKSALDQTRERVFRRLALKFLTPRGWQRLSWDDLEEYVRTSRASLRFQSPHLGATLEVCDLRQYRDQGWPPVALAMEYYQCSLEEVIEGFSRPGQAKLPRELAVEWTRQVALGLQYLHDGDIPLVHRDVKPSNIMLKLPQGTRYDGSLARLGQASAVLTDFGTLGHRNGYSDIIVYRDKWKDERVYPAYPQAPPAPDKLREPQFCQTGMDISSFGILLEALAPAVEGDPAWLRNVAALCKSDPTAPIRAADLVQRLSPDWDLSAQLLRPFGHTPREHPHFQGREFVFDAFELFAGRCGRRQRGGVFVVVGPPGIGKTALLTHWASLTDTAPGFFFRYRDGVVDPGEMPRVLDRQLRQRFSIPADTLPNANPSGPQLEKLLEEIVVRHKFPPGARLLLFIDALDEASDPLQAVQNIPKSLPPGVFVIASSRPAIRQGKDHLALLDQHQPCLLDPCADNNIEDLTEYIHSQLGSDVSSEAARKMARSVGGVFLLARYLIEDLLNERVTVAEAVRQEYSWEELSATDMLFRYYRQSWDRLVGQKLGEPLAELATLLAACLNWVSERLALNILRWLDERRPPEKRLWQGSTLFAEMIEALNWLAERRTVERYGYRGAFLQLRHQSVRDFLVSEDHAGPVRLEVEQMHADLGKYFQERARQDRWDGMDPYGRFYAVRHLLEAGDRPQLVAAAQLLTALPYLEATLGDESSPDSGTSGGGEG